MSDPRIDIATCCDLRMVDAATVLAASIKAHARAERPVRLFVITDAPSPDLAALAAAMNDAAFELAPLTCTNLHGDFPIRDHITAGTYLRFMLPELLPDIARVIYLDTDIVVHRSLEALFDTPLDGTAMAAAPDWAMLVGSRTWPTFFIPSEGKRRRFPAYAKQVLGLDCASADYFNCGVLVLDLDLWRRDTIAARTIRFLTETSGLYYMDQDALAAIIAGRYARLDARWNAFAINATLPLVNVMGVTSAGRRWAEVRRQWRRDPWIVHYAGANKPWSPQQPATVHDGLWWHYAALSPMKQRIFAAYRAQETASQGRRSKIPRAHIESGAFT